MGHPDARLDVVTGKEEKRNEDSGKRERNERMKDGDDDPLAARGTTALAARMKGRVALLPREFYLTAAAKTGHRPCASYWEV